MKNTLKLISSLSLRLCAIALAAFIGFSFTTCESPANNPPDGPGKPFFPDVKAVSSGGFSTAVIGTDGSLWAWGHSSMSVQLTLVRIGTDSNWAAVSEGGYHAAAIKTDGSLWAWGSNEYGQLGDGTMTNRFPPVRIGTDSNWAAVSAGGAFTIAIKTDGSLWAWGRYWDDDGTATIWDTPVRIGTDHNWAAVSVGIESIIAVKTDGSLWAWGEGNAGQLGDGIKLPTKRFQYTPMRIGTDNNWAAVSVGFSHIIALKTDGSLWAWGRNSDAQLGIDDGTMSDQTSPMRVGTDSNWVAMSAGWHCTVAVRTDGSLWGWGNNWYGQLGDDYPPTTFFTTPVRIGTDNDWAAVSLGERHTVALKTDGRVYTWGRNEYGQLGDGTTTDRDTPAMIP